MDQKQIARTSLQCLDYTSLNDTDTQASIIQLCSDAQTPFGNVAAVCVYPEFVKVAAEQLKQTGIEIATVINFPFGDKVTRTNEAATSENTTSAVQDAIADGATEIDIVLDYKGFLNGETHAEELISACQNAAKNKVIIKVILETAAFQENAKLIEACGMLVRKEVEFLKTSTGKHPKGGATMDAAVTLFAMAGEECGVKISGGVKTIEDCAAYLELVEEMDRPTTKNMFRFGASGILSIIKETLSGEAISVPKVNPAY